MPSFELKPEHGAVVGTVAASYFVCVVFARHLGVGDRQMADAAAAVAVRMGPPQGCVCLTGRRAAAGRGRLWVPARAQHGIMAELLLTPVDPPNRCRHHFYMAFKVVGARKK